MTPGGRWRLDVPRAFAAGVVGHAGEDGRRWLADLPDLVATLLEEWGLRPDGNVRHGFLGVVLSVVRGSHPFALKVSRPSAEVDNQLAALRAWAGRGMVELHAADPARGALLLERLDATRTLADTDPATAHATAAHLVRRLAVSAGDTDLTPLTAHVAGWPRRWAQEANALGQPLQPALIDAAVEVIRADITADALLVDHDLHLRNIAAGTREPWLALDPRGVVGDAEFTVAPMLWNDFRGEADLRERFATFVDVAGLDRGRTAAWTLVRVVDHLLWSTAAGLTWDPAACRAVGEWLLAGRDLP